MENVKRDLIAWLVNVKRKWNVFLALFCFCLSVSENKLFLHCVVSLKLHGYPSTPLIPAQSIPSTVMLPGLKACLVKCSTSEMVCVHVSLAHQKILTVKPKAP